MNAIPFLPQSASTFAPGTDALYLMLVAVSGAIALLVFALIVIFPPATGAARLPRAASSRRSSSTNSRSAGRSQLFSPF